MYLKDRKIANNYKELWSRHYAEGIAYILCIVIVLSILQIWDIF